MSQSTSFLLCFGPRPGENTWLWLIKIVTGPLLVIVLVLHFTVNHYLGSMSSGLMTYDDVIQYFQNPIIPAIEILFLITVVTHCLIGLRGIVLDMKSLTQYTEYRHLAAGDPRCFIGRLWDLACIDDRIAR